MSIVFMPTESGQRLRETLAASRARLPGAEARANALDLFERTGLPNRRIEDWKYTDLRALMREVYPLADAPDRDALAIAWRAVASHAFDGARKLVLVNGVLARELSDLEGLESGLSIRSLHDTFEAGDAPVFEAVNAAIGDNPMLALNSALMTDGVIVEIADGFMLDRPLHVVHVAASVSRASIATRSHLRLGKDSRATLVESFVAAGSAEGYQAHDAVLISVGAGARLDHVRLVEDAIGAFNISTALIEIGAHSHFNTFALTSGAGVSRYQMSVAIKGEGAQLATHGVNMLRGKQHGDTTLFVDHAVPGCTSREVFRAVLDDRARSVFQGRILVRQAAQKTDAKMMTRALLLSDEAEADNKPELEIFADDVTCGHGATSGALDESLLFYLRARGLPEKDAQALLIQAFVGEAIESIADDGLRDVVIAAAERWLAARG